MSQHPVQRMIDFLEWRIMASIDGMYEMDSLCRQIDTLCRLYIVKQQSVRMERMRRALEGVGEEDLQ